MTDKETLTFLAQIRRKLTLASRAYAVAHQRLNDVYTLLDKLDIDLDCIPTSAENASNLNEAISCHLQYGEYSMEGIMTEIENAVAYANALSFLESMQKRRDELGMTVKDLAEEAGLNEDLVSRIEEGAAVPRPNEIFLLKLALDAK